MDASSSNDFLIGFDLGTSAVKAVLTDTRGKIIARASGSVELIRPETDRYEIDPEGYFQNVLSLIAELAGKTPGGGTVKGISFCAASGNTIFLDESHRPVRNVISWLDRRCAGKETTLWPDLDAKEIYEQVGWPWSGWFPLAHLLWVRDFEPDTWRKTHFFGMNNDYLYHRLCGSLVVDPSKATTFYLQSQVKRAWNDKLLDYIGLSCDQLPAIVPSGTAVGTLKANLAESTGLNPEVQIVTGSFDHPSAARGTGVFDEGDLLISAGTSWVVFAPVGGREKGIAGGMLSDPFLSPSGCWGVMLSVPAVAEKVDTLLGKLFGTREDLYGFFDSSALEAEPGAGGLLINPLQQDSGEVLAETKGSTTADLSRSLMEGCAFLIRNRIEELERVLGREYGRVVMVGGPTKSPVWPRIVAEVLGVSLLIPETGAHAGAVGAAIMAGVGSGVFRDVKHAFGEMKSVERRIEPELPNIQLYEKRYQEFVTKFSLPADQH